METTGRLLLQWRYVHPSMTTAVSMFRSGRQRSTMVLDGFIFQTDVDMSVVINQMQVVVSLGRYMPGMLTQSFSQKPFLEKPGSPAVSIFFLQAKINCALNPARYCEGNIFSFSFSNIS
jgi:hypothetical protein